MSLQQSTRQEVFDRKGHECLFCGVTGEKHEEERGRDLDVHHVIPKRKGGADDPDNLIPVCIGCHKTLESTQGKALGRIADEELDRESLKDRVFDLQDEIDEKDRRLGELDDRIVDILDGVDGLLDDKISSKIYVVHESRITTSRLLYAGGSIEKAKEVFEESDRQVTIETTDVDITGWASDITTAKLEMIESNSGVLADSIRDYQLEMGNE